MGNTPNNATCGKPPNTLGDLILYTQQQDAAFYACAGLSIYVYVPLSCPIIYCQTNGTFSTPDVTAYQSHCAPVNERHTVIGTSGKITSPNYPDNFIPTLSNADIAWSIMTPGTNLVFLIEDFDIDAETVLKFVCGT
ncbi:hypothetical protein ACJMK2_029251, partial [Sinanodonta woodiana]